MQSIKLPPQLVNNYERLFRSAMGFALMIHLLNAQMSLVAFNNLNLLMLYLMFTALTAWDPLYALARVILSPFSSIVRKLDNDRNALVS